MRLISILGRYGRDMFRTNQLVRDRGADGRLPLSHSECGATAIEYGLIAALIAVAAITAMTNLGGGLNTTFNHVSANMQSGQ